MCSVSLLPFLWIHKLGLTTFEPYNRTNSAIQSNSLISLADMTNSCLVLTSQDHSSPCPVVAPSLQLTGGFGRGDESAVPVSDRCLCWNLIRWSRERCGHPSPCRRQRTWSCNPWSRPRRQCLKPRPALPLCPLSLYSPAYMHEIENSLISLFINKISVTFKCLYLYNRNGIAHQNDFYWGYSGGIKWQLLNDDVGDQSDKPFIYTTPTFPLFFVSQGHA